MQRNKEHSPNCLILEDNPARYGYLVNLMFQISYPYMQRLVIVTTANAAIRELARFKDWNVLMLDHDLDNQIYVDSESPNTGWQVAKYIKEERVEFETCIVHTLNDNGAKKMLDMLQGSGYVIYKPCVNLEGEKI